MPLSGPDWSFWREMAARFVVATETLAAAVDYIAHYEEREGQIEVQIEKPNDAETD